LRQDETKEEKLAATGIGGGAAAAAGAGIAAGAGAGANGRGAAGWGEGGGGGGSHTIGIMLQGKTGKARKLSRSQEAYRMGLDGEPPHPRVLCPEREDAAMLHSRCVLLCVCVCVCVCANTCVKVLRAAS